MLSAWYQAQESLTFPCSRMAWRLDAPQRPLESAARTARTAVERVAQSNHRGVDFASGVAVCVIREVLSKSEGVRQRNAFIQLQRRIAWFANPPAAKLDICSLDL